MPLSRQRSRRPNGDRAITLRAALAGFHPGSEITAELRRQAQRTEAEFFAKVHWQPDGDIACLGCRVKGVHGIGNYDALIALDHDVCEGCLTVAIEANAIAHALKQRLREVTSLIAAGEEAIKIGDLMRLKNINREIRVGIRELKRPRPIDDQDIERARMVLAVARKIAGLSVGDVVPGFAAMGRA